MPTWLRLKIGGLDQGLNWAGDLDRSIGTRTDDPGTIHTCKPLPATDESRPFPISSGFRGSSKRIALARADSEQCTAVIWAVERRRPAAYGR